MKTLNFNFVKYLLILGLILPLASCKDDGEVVEPPKRTEKEITAFSIPTLELTGVIDPATYAIVLTVTPDFDKSLLDGAVPHIEYKGVSIEPAATAPQNFAQDVAYKVTAEDGTFQNYTVSLTESEFVATGFAKASQKWTQGGELYGFTAVSGEPTLAYLDNKLVISRTGLLLNASDGTPTGDKLNVEGADGKFHLTTPASNYPFSVTNDDAGNVIGTSLGAWTKPNFPIYKWTSSLESPPALVIDIDDDGAIFGQFGRKISVVGDINANAWIAQYSHVQAGGPGDAQQYLWKVTAGQADPVWTAIQAHAADNTYYQTMIPMSTTDIYPFYLAASGHTSGNPSSGMFYTANASTESVFIDGFLGPDAFSSSWGNYIRHAKKFTFNGVTYLAVLSTNFPVEGLSNLYITLLDTRTNRVTTIEEIPLPSDIPNGATSITNSLEQTLGTGEKTIRLYTLISGHGVWCHELSNKP
jgi:hypothetical protein